MSEFKIKPVPLDRALRFFQFSQDRLSATSLYYWWPWWNKYTNTIKARIQVLKGAEAAQRLALESLWDDLGIE